MFDTDAHKEYLFLSYLIDLLPADQVDPIDLDGKLSLEYYKLQKTFEGAIELEHTQGVYVPSTKKASQGKKKSSTLDEIIALVNEKYKGEFTEGDRVMLGALHNKLMNDSKLESSARTSDPKIFTEIIFPTIFNAAALDSYTEAEESYSALFADKSKYDAIMNALAGVIYQEMNRKAKADHGQLPGDARFAGGPGNGEYAASAGKLAKVAEEAKVYGK